MKRLILNFKKKSFRYIYTLYINQVNTCITHKYIAELLSVFTEYYYCTFGIFRFPSEILNLHTYFKYVKKLCNEKFPDIRELDENFIMYFKEPRYIEWKSRHFLASLFADSVPFLSISTQSCRSLHSHQSLSTLICQ